MRGSSVTGILPPVLRPLALLLLFVMVGTGMCADAASAHTPGLATEAGLAARGTPIERAPDYTLMLESRRLVPEEGVLPALLGVSAAGGRRHVIIQFRALPDKADAALLESQGIMLLDYLPNFAYLASVSAEGLDWLRGFPGFRALVALEPEDKISAPLRKQGVSPHARAEGGAARLLVTFFGDVSAEDARATLGRYGSIRAWSEAGVHADVGILDKAIDEAWEGQIGGRVDAARREAHTLGLVVPEALISDLSGEDAIQWIAQAPPSPQLLVDNARATIGADSVQGPPYSLSGSGTALGIWDGGAPAPTHQDFAGRLTVPDGSPVNDHATATAGIMAGDGSRSEACGGTPYQWRGISTAADIIAYNMPISLLELRRETSQAIGTYGVMSSSNSWGWYLCGEECSYYGTYDDWSKVYDDIVRGSRGARISVVFAAGNDQSCLACGDSLPDFPYGTVAGPGATAKNTIAMGGTYSLDKTMTPFSSWGPVKDGRVKPDLVAPACNPTTWMTVAYPPNGYNAYDCGTSYAAPMVSGSLGILRQEFDSLGYGFIFPHTFKAILIQTAEDLGNPGPDYAFGHGHLQLKDAVDLVIANYPHNELIRVDSVGTGETDTYYMDVGPGVGNLRATLVWDDYAATPGAAKALVNDLDLVVQSPSAAQYRAYVLDPAAPSAPATTGYNDLDNVEVVEVSDPAAGRWTIRVEGSVVAQSPQDYTLVLPYECASTGVGGDVVPPEQFELSENVPNPFREITLIRFNLPRPAPVTLRIYDARGRLTRTLIDAAVKPAGTHMAYWDGLNNAGHAVAPGVYSYRIETGTNSETRRMVLLR